MLAYALSHHFRGSPVIDFPERESLFNGGTYFSLGAIIFTSLYFVQCSIGEVDLLSLVVNGQAIGCANVFVNDNDHVEA